MSNEYSLMEDSVNEICRSLVEESHLWVIETFTMYKKWSNVEYWISNGSVTSIWVGSTRDQVFSYDQGNRISRALAICKQKQATVSQQKVIASMKKTPAVVNADKVSVFDQIKRWFK